MEFSIRRQQEYSRGELLLRTFFGWLYIAIPHGFLLFFFGIGQIVVRFITFWIILFTGKFPRGFFDYDVQLLRWMLRFNMSALNLADGYPPFGLDAQWEPLTFNVQYTEERSRGLAIMVAFFGGVILIPHIICLVARHFAQAFVSAFQWFHILFAGEAHEGAFNFTVGTLRWAMRINLYMLHISEEYPPFTGKPLSSES